MSEDLKPCPFCGTKNVRRNGNNYQIWCLNDDCKENMFIDAETWQNAYCWKQLAKQKAVIGELVEALEDIATGFGDISVDEIHEIQTMRDHATLAIAKAQEITNL